jgi:UDP-glucose 4-epimerase
MKNLKGSKIAVTGGCGFIGSHLVERLRREGAEVIVIDKMLRIADKGSIELGSNERQFFYTQLAIKGCDYLFHLAAEKHNQSKDQPLKIIDTNITGTHQLLQAALNAGVKKVVFTSSLYAYGRMTGIPMCEMERPEPRTVYGMSKLAGEHLCHHFFLQHGLPSICLRLFFAYGPRQYEGMGYKSVIVKNFERMLDGLPPIINGDGNQVLDYIFVDDVIDRLIIAMVEDDAFDMFNVGSGVGVSINELTKLMVGIVGYRDVWEFAPADFTAYSSRVADTGKFDERFGKRPLVSLEEGLRRTFDWIVANRKAKR